jgi:hypothetical protein
MKYKKQIATGALALSLLVGGSSVFAATPQDLGIKKVQPIYQKQNKNSRTLKVKSIGKDNTVGTISAINDTGFIVDIKNLKAKTTSSVDVKTDASTMYSKNGVKTAVSDLTVGQKVIVIGTLDKTTNILSASQVKMVTKTTMPSKVKKGN